MEEFCAITDLANHCLQRECFRQKSKPEPHKIKEKYGIITTKWRRMRKHKERSSELAKFYVPSSIKQKRTLQQSVQKTAAPKRPLHPYLHN